MQVLNYEFQTELSKSDLMLIEDEKSYIPIQNENEDDATCRHLNVFFESSGRKWPRRRLGLIRSRYFVLTYELIQPDSLQPANTDTDSKYKIFVDYYQDESSYNIKPSSLGKFL
tara:strand:- start:202 stop:543 length:342 start_codon:yes stop_codon:yes gene_type:complete